MTDTTAGGDATPTRGFSASMLRSLRHRNYRLFVVGQGLSLFGTWMTTVATRWLVYEKMPGQDWILGVVTFAGQIPILLAPLAGTWVEGASRHRTLVLTQALSMIQSFSLAFLALSGLVEVWQVLVLAAFQGVVNALDVPARQAFLVEMVEDRNDLGNAIALNSSMFNGARLLGPAVAGMILAAFTGRVGWGAGICFTIDGISYLAVIIALVRMNVKPQPTRTSDRRIWREMRDGFRYSFHSRPIRAILLLLGLVSIFGAPFMVLMPAFAKNILHGNAGTYGILLAVSGAGALLGGVYLASRTTVLGLGRVIAVCCALFAITVIVFAFSTVLWLTMLATCLASFGIMVQMAASNTILQTIVEDEMRARVMSFYAVTVLGMIPVGSLLCSGLVVIIGAPYTVALGGVVALGGAIYFSLILPELRAAARPMLERAGVLPPLAAGLQAATNQTGEAAEEPMQQHDLIVIGSGPGGYTAGIRAAQLGLNVACIERESRLGGTCLRIGCIPSKALLESTHRLYDAQHSLAEHGVRAAGVEFDLSVMLRRKEQIVATLTKGVEILFKKNKVTRYLGQARFNGAGHVLIESTDGTNEIAAPHVLIATGSKPASLPGIKLDGKLVGTSTEALSYDEVPKHLVVVGAGYIGMELGSVWKRLGAKVSVLEFLDRILPGTDTELAREAHELFKKQGIEFRLSSRVTSARAEGPSCIVECVGAEPIRCDRVLVAVGRVPNTDGLGLDAIGIATDAKGYIPVDRNFLTAAPGVFAIGDCIVGPMLAHKAEEEGVACVERIVTGYGHVNYGVIPAVIFTFPEIAAVGKTEDQLLAEMLPYRKGTFPFRANSRARTLGELDGKVKILADAKTDRVLGVHILGPQAGDLIAEAAAAMSFGASSEDIARTCHAHPTLPEAIKEAALAVDGRAINY